MGIPRRSREAGGTSLSVQTTLENPSTRPGLLLNGEVLIVGDHRDAPVDHVVVGLFTEVEMEAEDGWLVEFYRVAVSGSLPVPPGSRRVVPFSLVVPYETPLTHARGAQLGGMAMGLRVELEVARKVEPHDLLAVTVHPLPVHQLILDAFVRAGFRLRQIRVQGGRIPRVAQILPFFQDFGFWAASQYADRITEVGVIFVTDPAGADVILTIDRWAHADAGVPTSTHRMRVEHASADTTDWDALIERWLDWAVAWHVRRYHYRYLYQVGPQAYRVGRRSAMGTAGAGGEDHDDGTGSTT
jgi:sporulation-control protein